MSETALTATRRELRPGLIARFAGAFCDADFSRAIALSSMLLGAVSGLVIGLWSFGGPFPEPAWVGSYSELPRRLIRLAHIALFALGMINLMLARQHAGIDLPEQATRLALAAMNVGTLLMPALLFATVFLPAAKYLLAVPALAVTLALAIAATGGWRQWRLRSKPEDPRRTS
jgi:hypothetical protein